MFYLFFFSNDLFNKFVSFISEQILHLNLSNTPVSHLSVKESECQESSSQTFTQKLTLVHFEVINEQIAGYFPHLNWKSKCAVERMRKWQSFTNYSVKNLTVLYPAVMLILVRKMYIYIAKWNFILKYIYIDRFFFIFIVL